MASVLFTEGLQRAIAVGLDELGKGGAWPILQGMEVETREALAKDLTFTLQRHNLPKLGAVMRKPPLPTTLVARSRTESMEKEMEEAEEAAEEAPVVVPTPIVPPTAAKGKGKGKGKTKTTAVLVPATPSPKAVNIKDSRSIGTKMITYLKNMGMTWPSDRGVEKAKKAEMVAWFNALPSDVFQGLKTPEQQAEYYLKNVYATDVDGVEELTDLLGAAAITAGGSNAVAGGKTNPPPVNVVLLTDEELAEMEEIRPGFDKAAVLEYLNAMPPEDFQLMGPVEHMWEAWKSGAEELDEMVFNSTTFLVNPTTKKVYNEHGEYQGVLGVGAFALM